MNPTVNGIAVVTWQPTATTIAAVTLDASIEESHHSSVDSTDSPIENGPDVTDHLRVKPDQITIKGIVTNYPLDSYQGTTTGSTTVNGNAVTNGTGTAATLPGADRTAHEAFLALKGSPTLITVVTSLHTYTKMALTDYTATRNSEHGQDLTFTMTLKEIQVVQNQTVQIARAPAQTPNMNVNKQAVQPAPKSYAASLTDLIGQKTGSSLGGLAQ